jgi:hypothetical protein
MQKERGRGGGGGGERGNIIEIEGLRGGAYGWTGRDYRPCAIIIMDTYMTRMMVLS